MTHMTNMTPNSLCLWGRLATCAPIGNRRKLARVLLTALTVSHFEARAEQVLFRAEPWVVSAPDRIDCSKPVLTAQGPGALFEASNRSHLEAIRAGIAPAVTRQCPSLTEAILVNGRTRHLITLSREPIPPSGLPASEEKCETLLTWLRRVDQEYP